LLAKILLFEANLISFDFSFSFLSAAIAAVAAAWTASGNDAAEVVAGAEITTFFILEPSDALESSDWLADSLMPF
jgi:hypothetical protein